MMVARRHLRSRRGAAGRRTLRQPRQGAGLVWLGAIVLGGAVLCAASLAEEYPLTGMGFLLPAAAALLCYRIRYIP
jgi:hypothetical protein